MRLPERAIDDALKSLENVTADYCLMITEDEEDYRFLIEFGFKQIGFSGKIISTVNGQDLMDYLLKRSKYQDQTNHPLPDFILLDMRMPKKDGRQVLIEMKEHDSLKEIPVIVFTANQIEGEREEMLSLGALDYLLKPNSTGQLKITFKAILNHWIKVISE